MPITVEAMNLAQGRPLASHDGQCPTKCQMVWLGLRGRRDTEEGCQGKSEEEDGLGWIGTVRLVGLELQGVHLLLN